MHGLRRLSMSTGIELDESEREDAQLASDAHGGSHAAFNRLMDKHQPTVLRYLTGHIRNSADAYDIAQDTFVAVFKNLDRYDRSRPFLAWLFVIARNKARDHHRRQRTLRWVGLDGEQDVIATDAPDPEVSAIGVNELSKARDIIATLPDGLRTPLLLSVMDELSLAEIGDVMGISTKAAEVRIYRARKLLKEHFYP